MIIDVHAHIHADENRDHWDHFLGECRKSRLALVIVCSVGHFERYPEAEDVRKYNAVVEKFNEYAGPEAEWIAYLNPQHESWREELDLCLQGGAIGIKLWVSLKNEQGGLEETADVIRCAQDKGLPVLIHTYSRTDPQLPGEVTIEEFAALAEQFPSATLVGAHAGGNWRHTIGVLRDRSPNAYVDVCGSYPEKGIVETLVREMGAERVIYGSDMLGRSLPSQIAKVTLADITEREKELILWQNAAKVFGLKDVAEPEGEEHIRPQSELPDHKEDHFCFCGRWPFFETPCATPQELDAVLAEQAVERAYTGDLGSIYRMDLEAANRGFLESCKGCGRVAPLAVVNPRAQNWLRVLESMDPGVAGVILHPYLHNWQLDDPEHAPLFHACSRRSIPVWINGCLGDYRFRHSGLTCHPPTVEELIAFGKSAPENRYVFQGMGRALVGPFLEATGNDPKFRFEISRLTDNTGALDTVLKAGGRPNLVMGSEFPLRDIREVWWTALRQ